MYNDPVQDLIHLYEDGALNRRDLLRRLTKLTGTAAAALAAVESAGLAQTTPAGCPVGVQVAESDPDITAQPLTLYGEGGPLFAYQAVPKAAGGQRRPAVLVIHENAGLSPYIKDVTRRVAKAGYVALAVDLLSRQGGTEKFPDAVAAMTAYNQTTVDQRRQDMLSALYTIRDQGYVQGNKLGVVGFCAGGGNVYDLALNTDALSAAVVFYGPPPAPDQFANLTAPLLAFYAELDRGITGRVPSVMTALNDRQKRYELHIYENTNHGFHNDTGARYDAGAACDAWGKTLSFFDRHLKSA